MINNTVLVGRTTKDTELKYTNSNLPFVKFTLAVNRTYSNANGEKETDFIQCIVWRKQAENMAKFVNKGNLIGVVGRIETGSYDNQDGVKIYTTTVVCDSIQFLEPKGQQAPKQEYKSKQDYTPSIDVDDPDLLPF